MVTGGVCLILITFGTLANSLGRAPYRFLSTYHGIATPIGSGIPAEAYRFPGDPATIYEAGKRELLADGWIVSAEHLDRGTCSLQRNEFEVAEFATPRWFYGPSVPGATCQWTIAKHRGWMAIFMTLRRRLGMG